MPRTRTEPTEETVPPTASEQAQAEADARAAGLDRPEVLPEELGRGIDAPVWLSPLPALLVEELRAPLNPNRVRRRKGRGSGQFEYLAGHDVKRRANELFGFGNWATSVVRLEETDRIEIVEQNDGAATGRVGWHVGYLAVVRVSIRTEHGDWISYEDSGYGDGNEWGPAARVTARELALKEAVTDALKRAFTCLGDQFGLILYAKADEKQRIERDQRSESSGHAVRVDPEGPKPPANWAEALDRFDRLLAVPDEAEVWLGQLVKARFQADSMHDLDAGKRQAVFVGFCSALLALESETGEIALAPGLRSRIAEAFAAKNEGVALTGPPWRVGPDEPTIPTRTEYENAKAEEAGAA